ncbi:S8 family serine peptidase [Streptomyces sp. NPDC057460]|uniref:S8 family serine peptidase n=1 Tax=Streptomyces sp. NPDC057460 TaxID=3346141 RepID=UPI003693751E
MASPHVAGVVALLLQARPDLTPAQVQTALQNTATPLAMTGDHERGRQPVAQQGAGRIDAVAALASVSGDTVRATPSELALGDLEGRQRTRRITVHNPTSRPVTYRVGQSAAVSAAPPYTSEWQPTDSTGDAEVDGRERITVAAHGRRTVTVHIRQRTHRAAAHPGADGPGRGDHPHTTRLVRPASRLGVRRVRAPRPALTSLRHGR